jgi:hypothetical protein
MAVKSNGERMSSMKFGKGGSIPRRDILMLGTASAALFGPGSMSASESNPKAKGELVYPQEMGLALLRNYRTAKASSYDRSGGNNDWRRLEPGGTLTLMESAGPGVISHIWFTIAAEDAQHLKRLILRMFWEGEAEPSVEVPVGDFFGLNLGEYFLYESALLNVAAVKGLNAYFPMPFRKSALITVTSECDRPVDAYYWNIDYQLLPELPENIGYFHAQYRQAAPCPGWQTAAAKNPDGTNNYVFMEATGRGHLVGVTQGVVLNQDGWWGEGDDMLFVDDSTKPVTNGTGSEDYYNGAWGFEGKSFNYRHIGAPYVVNPFSIGGRWCLYRWHVDAPLAFEKSIRFTIEHGSGNDRSDDFYSVAYWYQTEPHAKFPPLPPATERMPKIFAVPGGANPVGGAKLGR